METKLLKNFLGQSDQDNEERDMVVQQTQRPMKITKQIKKEGGKTKFLIKDARTVQRAEASGTNENFIKFYQQLYPSTTTTTYDPILDYDYFIDIPMSQSSKNIKTAGEIFADVQKRLVNLKKQNDQEGFVTFLKSQRKALETLGYPIVEIPPSKTGAQNAIIWKYSYVVGSDQTYLQAKQNLGPLAVLGLPVWVNTSYANAAKATTDQDGFRKWISYLTKHNGKMGVNSDALGVQFTQNEKVLDVPSSSAYINFLEIAGKVESVDTTKVLKASTGVIEKIKQQTKAQGPPNTKGEIFETFAGRMNSTFDEQIVPDQNYAGWTLHGQDQENLYNSMMMEKDKAQIKELQHSHADLQNRLKLHEAKEITLGQDHAHAITHSFKKCHKAIQSINTTGELMYKAAIAAPMNPDLIQPRIPMQAKVPTLSLMEPLAIPINIKRQYAMLVCDFTAGTLDPLYLIQSAKNFFVTQPTMVPRVVGRPDDDNPDMSLIEVTGMGGSELVQGDGDIDAIQSGDLVIGGRTEYQTLSSKIRLVAAGLAVSKTSHSETEGGIIRVLYTSGGQLYQTGSINDHVEAQRGTEFQRDFYPSQAKSGGGIGHLFDVTYRPTQTQDVDYFYDKTEPHLIQPDRLYTSDLIRSFFDGQAPNKGYVGPLQYESTLNNEKRRINTCNLLSPHKAIILFDNVNSGNANGMSFEVKLNRYFEAIPSREARIIGPETCSLNTADSPLDLLRKDITFSLEDQNFLTGVLLQKGCTQQEIDDCLGGWGIFGTPLIRDWKESIQHGVHAIGQAINKSDMLRNLLPEIADQLISRVTGSSMLAKMGRDEVADYISKARS